MAEISISMSDAMEEFVATRVESASTSSRARISAIWCGVISEKGQARQKLRKMLDDAEASGVSEKSFDEIWEAGAEQGSRKRRAK